jgi:GDPmannose 4,6-dehydratase
MPKKVALITGVTGQDGAYLARLLLNQGYEVHGVRRRSSSFNTGRIDSIYVDPHLRENKFFLHYADLADTLSLSRLITIIQPTEIYNLAAQSHVSVSFLQPEYSLDVNAIGSLRLLELLHQENSSKSIKFYQASTSELFGSAPAPQSETTPMQPQSPYAISKLAAYWLVRNYRDGYGIFACNGILFNHESPIRGETFVTRKITQAMARIKLGLQEKLYLGNLDSKRDWGHARDFVEAQYLIMQNDYPEDYVIATGEQHSVREFVELVALNLDVKLSWEGSGLSEVGRDISTGKVVIEIDPSYFRPLEVWSLLGVANKAENQLGWKPKTSFATLVEEMSTYDLELAKGRNPEIKWLN